MPLYPRAAPGGLHAGRDGHLHRRRKNLLGGEASVKRCSRPEIVQYAFDPEAKELMMDFFLAR